METNTNINTSTKKSNTGLIIGGIMLIIAAFFVGKSYGASHAATPATGGASAYRTGAAGGFAGRTGGAGGSATVGQVVSMDANSITVSIPSGGSKIILYSPTTTVLKTAEATISSVAVGSTITATGTTNSDGSITATSIQIRPAGSTTPGANGGAAPSSTATQ